MLLLALVVAVESRSLLGSVAATGGVFSVIATGGVAALSSVLVATSSIGFTVSSVIFGRSHEVVPSVAW